MPKTKIQKREEALTRKRKYEMMSPFQKLNRLDGLLGLNQGAKKQRDKLMKTFSRYIERTGCMFRGRDPMSTAYIPSDKDVVITPEIVEQKEREERLKEESKAGMNTPMVIPKPRVRYVIPTVGKEQEARSY